MERADDISVYGRWAAVLVRYSLGVQPGQVVAIEASTTSEPLIRALHTTILQAGGYPVVALTLPGLGNEFFALAAETQLDVAEPIARFLAEQVDGRVQIVSADAVPNPLPVDASRVARWYRAQQPLLERFLARLEAGEGRLVTTLYPTEAAAAGAGLPFDRFAEVVCRAAFLDQPDPIQAWRDQSRRQQRLIALLQGKEAVHIGGNGTDLRLSIKDRRFCNADGRLNMPDGEVYTAPVEDSAEGAIAFADGVRLRFVRGQVVEASGGGIADMLAVDAGASRLGEFAFGTNPGLTEYTGNTALDEKLGGTVHLALGASLPGTGGTNTSATHRDFVCDLRSGGTVTVDGDIFLRDG